MRRRSVQSRRRKYGGMSRYTGVIRRAAIAAALLTLSSCGSSAKKASTATESPSRVAQGSQSSHSSPPALPAQLGDCHSIRRDTGSARGHCRARMRAVSTRPGRRVAGALRGHRERTSGAREPHLRVPVRGRSRRASLALHLQGPLLRRVQMASSGRLARRLPRGDHLRPRAIDLDLRCRSQVSVQGGPT